MGIEVEVEDDVEECVDESTREGIDDENDGLPRPLRWLPIIGNVAGFNKEQPPPKIRIL
jgi:hypothetical protein